MTQFYRALVRAPANIALIKYMGKDDALLNLPLNASLSLTLDTLCTVAEVEVETETLGGITWIPELPRIENSGLQLEIPRLTDAGIARMIHHIERVYRAIQEIFKLPSPMPRITFRTANTFPMSSGIASSASSFAAVTLATAEALCGPQSHTRFENAWSTDFEFKKALARLSRQGSGSSCRSFTGPWVLWATEDISPLQSKLPPLSDLIVLISSESKPVSSSMAHEQVRTSPLWNGRKERAEERVRGATTALKTGNLRTLSQIAWNELWEMHSLFHTCAEPFTYWEPETIAVLKWLKPFFQNASPPIVSLDAGANVHILVEKTQAEAWLERIEQRFPNRKVLVDDNGSGPQSLTPR